MAAIEQNHGKKSDDGTNLEPVLGDPADISVPEHFGREIELIFLENPTTFLLNYILMSVQFFENYDRDVDNLRKRLFRQTSLADHHKTCFHADSIHDLVGKNVKFRPRHGNKKLMEELLHPIRVYVSYDNVSAAYDPSFLQQLAPNILPHYKLTVTPCENDKKEKFGYVYLSEFESNCRGLTDPTESGRDCSPVRDAMSYHEHYERNANRGNRHWRSAFDPRGRRLTKVEKIMAHQRLSIFAPVTMEEDLLPHNAYYRYINLCFRTWPIPIAEYRMNQSHKTSHEIPGKCFQGMCVSLNSLATSRSRKTYVDDYLDGGAVSKKVLNSAAFKGGFCDLLIDELSDPLKFDGNDVRSARVQQEFIMFEEKERPNHVAPIIEVLDWSYHVKMGAKRNRRKATVGAVLWPTYQMELLLRKFPGHVVPSGFCEPYIDNLDYEKEWRLEFPRSEEYLLHHIMHQHWRCYLFALVIYKSFLETEVNVAAFGPKHLLHHLFWMIHKDFCAWSEETPGEDLLNYLQTLYKRLRNKFLPDFFINSRNLFAESHPRDLHRAQFIIKMILDNPVAYVLKALGNLTFNNSFYPMLNVTELVESLKAFNVDDDDDEENNRVESRQSLKKQRSLSLGDLNNFDEESKWRKRILRRLRLGRKVEVEKPRESVDSIDIEDVSRVDLDTFKGYKLLDLFITHFAGMGLKSIDYDHPNQAYFYLQQTKKLSKVLSDLPAAKTQLETLRRAVAKVVKQLHVPADAYSLTKLDSSSSTEDVRTERSLSLSREQLTRHSFSHISIGKRNNENTKL